MFSSRYLSAAIGLALAGAVFAETRMDAALHVVAAYPALAQRMVPQPVRPAGLITPQGVTEATVPALLRFEGDGLAQVKALGTHVRSVTGNIATVDLPVARIKQIAALPGVVFIEAARKMRQRLDVSVPATHADTLRSGTGLNLTGATGKGVIVGIVDDGIDFRHMDFRNADGTTRLLQLWDMRSAAAAGNPPPGYSYGGVCTADMINRAIQLQSGGCLEPSTGGHGTHVAGIAAGNGQATGNGQPAFRMVGMAPQADIVAANPLGDGVSASDSVVDGVSYVKQVAKAAGKPAVVNLSLGSYYGSRDGTSNYEQALSSLVEPGFFITGAVGNEADAPIRATGTINQGQSVDLGYNVPDASKTYNLEMWYPGTQAFSVRVKGPSGSGADCDSQTVNAASASSNRPVVVNSSCGVIVVTSTDTLAVNDDRQILITLMPGDGSSAAAKEVTAGAWTVTLTATKVNGGSTTFSMIGGETAQDGTFLDHTESTTAADGTTSGTTTQIITDTASATNVIGVAAYNTKKYWNSIKGGRYSFLSVGAVGDIANFSSAGPRRDCSNLSKCPQAMKPEITAPGAAIVSALASDKASPDQTLVAPDGVHITEVGTSMATPHVTGAIALLLQANPKLTLAQLRSALFGHVQTVHGTAGQNLPVYNAQTLLPQTPNYRWGYGVLDVAQAYNALGSQAVTTPTFALHRSAANGVVSYTATITPRTADVNTTTNVFIGAQAGNNLFLRSGDSSWLLYDGQSIPVAATTTTATSFDVNIATLPDATNAALVGTNIYVGYGSSVSDMLNGKVGVAGSIQ